MSPRAVALMLAAFGLAGCENDVASYLIGGAAENALTLVRQQRWLWDREVDVHLVVARYPECQRRYELNKMPAGQVDAEVFQRGPQSFLLRQGRFWYQIDLRSCILQPAAAPPATVGAPAGAFAHKDGKLRFVPAV